MQRSTCRWACLVYMTHLFVGNDKFQLFPFLFVCFQIKVRELHFPFEYLKKVNRTIVQMKQLKSWKVQLPMQQFGQEQGGRWGGEGEGEGEGGTREGGDQREKGREERRGSYTCIFIGASPTLHVINRENHCSYVCVYLRYIVHVLIVLVYVWSILRITHGMRFTCQERSSCWLQAKLVLFQLSSTPGRIC